MEVLNNDIKLITLVERFPQLYDKSNKNFKDRIAVENAWLFISGELQTPSADCINRWTSLRNRFSKERNKRTPSGSAAEKTEWPLMRYLTFLQSVVKKRRTFGNILKEKSHSPWESQTYDEDDTSLIDKDDSLLACTDYEYLDETVSDTYSDLPMEESFEPLNLDGQEARLVTSPLVVPQRATTFDTNISQRPITPKTPDTFTSQRPITPKTPDTFTSQRPITSKTPDTSTSQRSITPNTPITQNTFTPLRPTTPNLSILQSPTPKALTSQRSITPNTSVPRVNQKRKQLPGIEEHLSDAVGAFKKFVADKNTATTEDVSLKYFCDSLYGDLKNLDKKDLISCKIEIMQIISKYTLS